MSYIPAKISSLGNPIGGRTVFEPNPCPLRKVRAPVTKQTLRTLLLATSAASLAACAQTVDDNRPLATTAAPTETAVDTTGANAFDFPPARAADPMGRPGIPFSGEAPDTGNKAVLDALMMQGLRPYHTLTPDEAREEPLFIDGVKAVMRDRGMTVAPPEGLTERTIEVPGAAGSLSAIIVRPEGDTEPKPLVVYFHGGGWVLADAQAYIASARALAKQLDAVVISVNYRRAPETKFPGQHADALAAYRAIRDNAAALGGDASRMVLAGESAGGNLAVATAIQLRNIGEAQPDHILSVYPVAGTNLNTESYQRNANALPLNRAAMAWFFHHTLASPADLRNPLLNLIEADLSGLAPVTIVQAEIDPLLTEGKMLAERLRAVGNDVSSRMFDGATHEFFGADPVIDDADDAQRYAVARIRSTLN